MRPKHVQQVVVILLYASSYEYYNSKEGQFVLRMYVCYTKKVRAAAASSVSTSNNMITDCVAANNMCGICPHNTTSSPFVVNVVSTLYHAS